MRIEVQLRNCAVQKVPTLRIIDAATRNPVHGFEEPLLVPAHNGHIDVRREMDKLINAVQSPGSTEETYISNRIIQLCVAGPQVPSIDLVDLPGIRKNWPGTAMTEQIVNDHIR